MVFPGYIFFLLVPQYLSIAVSYFCDLKRNIFIFLLENIREEREIIIPFEVHLNYYVGFLRLHLTMLNRKIGGLARNVAIIMYHQFML